jgi:lipopolysaccharide/colanic/teichoic acid biosynthesis glycosyltransferase
MGKEIKEAKVVEKEETTEVKEEVKETKKEEKKDVAKTIIKKVWDIIFWVAVLCLVAIWITDFALVKQDKDPKFCIKKETITTEKGTIEACTGLGYKIYKYDTEGLRCARDFGPFWQDYRK